MPASDISSVLSQVPFPLFDTFIENIEFSKDKQIRNFNFNMSLNFWIGIKFCCQVNYRHPELTKRQVVCLKFGRSGSWGFMPIANELRVVHGVSYHDIAMNIMEVQKCNHRHDF